MNDYWKIEKDIPLPKKVEHKKDGKGYYHPPYENYLYMNVGDSVLVPNISNANAIRNLFIKKGKKAVARCVVLNQAYRVWRVA